MTIIFYNNLLTKAWNPDTRSKTLFPSGGIDWFEDEDEQLEYRGETCGLDEIAGTEFDDSFEWYDALNVEFWLMFCCFSFNSTEEFVKSLPNLVFLRALFFGTAESCGSFAGTSSINEAASM